MKFTLSLLLMFLFANAFAQTMFRRTYGFGSVNEGKCIIQTFDHGYAIAGSTTPGWGGQTNAYLVKTDSMGAAEFHYSFGGGGIEKASSVLQLPDSGFLLAGFSNGFGQNNDYDALLVRTDKTGSELWERSFGTSDWDFIYDMKRTSDGNVILAGSTYGSGNGSAAGYVVKVDLSGNVIWQKVIPSATEITLHRVIEQSNGNFAACGLSETLANSSMDGFIVILGANGDSLHSAFIDKGGDEVFNALGSFSNGDLALGGNFTDTSGRPDEFIMRTDTLLNEIWNSISPQTGEDMIGDLIVMNDTLLTAGSTTTSGEGHSDFHIVLYNEFGGWYNGQANTFGGSENEFCYSVIVSNDQGYVLAGTSTSFGPGLQSILVVKSDRAFTFDPNVTINITDIDGNHASCYPNPSSGLFRINSANMKEADVTVTGITGQTVYAGHQRMPVEIRIETPGIYVVRLTDGVSAEISRVIITGK